MKHTETELERACCRLARSRGLVAIKLQNNLHKGVPDRLFIQEGGKCLFVEFKNPEHTGKLSENQKTWQQFLQGAFLVVDNYEFFQKAVNQYFK